MLRRLWLLFIVAGRLPSTVKATFELFATLTSPPGTNSSTEDARFGQAAAVKGPLMVITENRFAHVYRRLAEMDWELLTTLNPDNNETLDDEFGASVAFDGTTIAVGAPNGGDNQGGLVYLYEERSLPCERGFFHHRKCDEVEWTLIQTLNASNPDERDEFGLRISLDGFGRLAVAIRDDDTIENNSGAAQVFQRIVTKQNRRQLDEAEWIPDGGLVTADDAALDDRFGDSIAIYQDLLVVGAKRKDTVKQATGAVYLFRRNVENGEWVQTQRLVASDADSIDFFGDSVVISDNGSLIVIGTPSTDDVENNSGSTYVFEAQSDGTFVETAKLTDSSPRNGAQFGRVLTIVGDVLVVGAWKDVVDGKADAGSAVVFNSTLLEIDNNDQSTRRLWFHHRDEVPIFEGNRTWEELQKIRVNGTAESRDTFASTVALNCDGSLVIGAPGRNEDAGVAYLYFAKDLFDTPTPPHHFFRRKHRDGQEC